VRSNVSEVWAEANKIINQISRWVESHDGSKPFINYKPIDQVRLLTLKTWELRYHLPILEILDLLVPPLRKHIAKRPGKKKKYNGLGVSIVTLCSHGAEEILQRAIEKKYPDSEHVSIWRSTTRDRQLKAEKIEALEGLSARVSRPSSILDYDLVSEFSADYCASVDKKRLEHTNALLDPKRKRKRYRFNPWI
jgi:hypothetical protein